MDKQNLLVPTNLNRIVQVSSLITREISIHTCTPMASSLVEERKTGPVTWTAFPSWSASPSMIHGLMDCLLAFAVLPIGFLPMHILRSGK